MTHLTLSQCECLKEVGYPQRDETEKRVYCPTTHFVYYPQYGRGGEDSNGSLYILGSWGEVYGKGIPEDRYDICTVTCPTLEELIDWLGDDFRNLEKWSEGTEYVARSFDRNIQIPEPAKSPLEAVYNLAIAVRGKEGK